MRSSKDLLGAEPPNAKRGPGRPVEDHRQRLVLAQARVAELKGDQLAGKLVDRESVVTHWAAIIADTRQRLLAVAARAGDKAGLTRRQTTILDAEIRAVLAAMADASPTPHAGTH